MKNRSDYVSVLSWILIIFSGIFLFISIAQLVLYFTAFQEIPFDNIGAGINLGVFSKVITSVELLMVLILVFEISLLVFSILLLKRIKVARL